DRDRQEGGCHRAVAAGYRPRGGRLGRGARRGARLPQDDAPARLTIAKPWRSVGDSATPRFGGVALFVCAVARADERAREDGAEPDRLALLAEPAELVGMHPAVDRRVLRGRLQVLA